MLPYFDGERTPNLPDARGSLHGISRDNLTPPNIARAAVEGMLGGLADAVDALVNVGVEPRRVLLVGGAAANPAVVDVAATLVDAPVEVPPAGEYVADGAARQAAWVLLGDGMPAWPAVREGETVRRDREPSSAGSAPVPRCPGGFVLVIEGGGLSRVLRALHAAGALTRSDLGALTGLNRSTVATIVNELVAAGVVEEGAGSSGGVGRPSLVVRRSPTRLPSSDGTSARIPVPQ
jgi:hypothetical protein